MQREIATRHITTCHFVPSILTLFVANPDLASCSSLEYVVCSGEALLSKDSQALTNAIPHVQIWNYYGPTEASIDVTYHLYNSQSDVYSVSIGGPVANTQLYILDENLNPVPIGVAGELYLGGIQLARGYYKRPDLTAGRFIPNPFVHHPQSGEYQRGDSDGSRLYATGDLCSFTPGSGDVNYIGRTDFQVKIRGFRIELGEVEIKTSSHPAVKDVVATAHTTDFGSKQLVVYFTPSPDYADDPALPTSLRAYLAANLPAYMVPSHLIQLAKFPLLPNGKLNRHLLPKPNTVSADRKTDFCEPRNETERILVEVWKTVLKLEAPIGILDNFFELGGDSILSIQVASKLRDHGLSVSVKQLFEYRNISELARHVVLLKRADVSEQGLIKGSTPLAPIQSWFLSLGLNKQDHFNQAQIVTVPRGLTQDTLKLLAQALLTHHDILRIRVQDKDRLDFTSNVSVPCSEVVDLSDLPAERKLELRKVHSNQAQASLDIANGLIVRFVLFRDSSETEEDLLVAIHHMAVDGVSWRVLAEDIQTLANHLTKSNSLPEKSLLPSKTSSFKTWSESLAKYSETHSKEAAKEDQFWSGLVTKIASVPSLGVALDKVEDTIDTVASTEMSLSEAETAALLGHVCSLYHAQINDVLLAGFALALIAWREEENPSQKSDSVAFMLEGHGREDLFEAVDVSRTVGWFTSLFPVYVSLEGTPRASLDKVMKLVKEQLHAVPNKGIGYGILNYLSQPADQQATRYNLPTVAEEISFNYLGQFSGKDALFSKDVGDCNSLNNHLYRVLDVNGMVTNAKLNFSVAYPSRHFPQERVQKLMDHYAAALRSLVHHCEDPATVGGYTPSDFPLVPTTQDQLDLIIAKYGHSNISDLLPLSPMQSGMLYHSLIDRHNQEYITQLKWTIFRDQFELLTPENMKSSWQAIIDRHNILRTSFFFAGHNIPPAQIVLKKAEVSWTELRLRNKDELMEVLRKDRELGFDVTAAPLMRCCWITLEDSPVRILYSPLPPPSSSVLHSSPLSSTFPLTSPSEERELPFMPLCPFFPP
jgi:non-ribosomal peptide synthase protein (TIGR01720 family)